jgi:hypothetical protein
MDNATHATEDASAMRRESALAIVLSLACDLCGSFVGREEWHFATADNRKDGA